jgi:hypothetical protein
MEKRLLARSNSNIENDFELKNTLFSTLGTTAQLADGRYNSKMINILPSLPIARPKSIGNQ